MAIEQMKKGSTWQVREGNPQGTLPCHAAPHIATFRIAREGLGRVGK